MKILDCTLRDGGYYNKWDFSETTVQSYLSAMDSLGVDCIEIGFRSSQTQGYFGPFAFSHDTHLDELDLPQSTLIAVMVNASDLLSNSKSQKEIIHDLFSSRKESRISIVRLACHLNEVYLIEPAVNELFNLGYQVFINVMQFNFLKTKDIEQLSDFIDRIPINAFYIADSLGNIEPVWLAKALSTIKENTQKAIGFHAHDNSGRALENIEVCRNHGVDWIDATVTGMGRGAGNAQIEFIYAKYPDLLKKDKQLSSLINLVDKIFAPMQKTYGWGTNLFYFFGSRYNIHPTYIQSLLESREVLPSDVYEIILRLSAIGGSSFKKENLDLATSLLNESASGDFAPNTVLRGQEVLIVGAGPSVLAHKKAIEKYITKFKPIVLALNTHEHLDKDLINYYVACHPIRIYSDISKYNNIDKPLVFPLNSIPSHLIERLNKVEILNFGFHYSKKGFAFSKKTASSPALLAISYALAIATSGKAIGIKLVGFDGYDNEYEQNIEVENMFADYLQHSESIPVTSLTDTLYKIETTSIYNAI